jgi:hypothetical protein
VVAALPGGNVGTSNLTLFQPASFGNTVAIAYDATAKTYTVTAPNNTVLTFGPADLLTATTNPANTDARVIAYHVNSGTTPASTFQIVTPSIGGVDLTYTRVGAGLKFTNFGTPSSITDIIVGVFGVPTISSDMPKTGSATYSKVQVNGSTTIYTTGIPAPVQGGLQYSLSTSTGTFSADFAAGTIQTTLNLIPTTPSGFPATITLPTIGSSTATGTGSIATGTSNFTGTFGSSLAYTNGAFSGGFFGPQAAEFGYSFVFAGNAPGTGAYGTVVGAK